MLNYSRYYFIFMYVELVASKRGSQIAEASQIG